MEKGHLTVLFLGHSCMIAPYQRCQQISLPMKAQRSKLLAEQKANLPPIQSFTLSQRLSFIHLSSICHPKPIYPQCSYTSDWGDCLRKLIADLEKKSNVYGMRQRNNWFYELIKLITHPFCVLTFIIQLHYGLRKMVSDDMLILLILSIYLKKKKKKILKIIQLK